MNRPDSQWIGRRWFEMRVGYGTYMGFTFGFANFILLLHGLTDWFKDYPVHWFGIAMIAIIIPASVLIGHRHNRTQQKTETRNLTHLNPYIDTVIPYSKEVMSLRTMIAQADWMIEMAGDDVPAHSRRTRRGAVPGARCSSRSHGRGRLQSPLGGGVRNGFTGAAGCVRRAASWPACGTRRGQRLPSVVPLPAGFEEGSE